jgi:adenylate kinase family enzyme
MGNRKAKKYFPIVHIIGLPGAGKTTLGRRLSKRLKLPIYCIGEYRPRFPMTSVGEADAWLSLYRDLSKQKWKDCILETTGLNARESFLKAAFPIMKRVTIKLEAPKKVVYARIKMKRKDEQGGEWLFREAYQDKYEFVKKMFEDFKKKPAEIRIDTSKLRPDDVLRTVLAKLKMYCLSYDIDGWT